MEVEGSELISFVETHSRRGQGEGIVGNRQLKAMDAQNRRSSPNPIVRSTVPVTNCTCVAKIIEGVVEERRGKGKGRIVRSEFYSNNGGINNNPNPFKRRRKGIGTLSLKGKKKKGSETISGNLLISFGVVGQLPSSLPASGRWPWLEGMSPWPAPPRRSPCRTRDVWSYPGSA